MSFGPSRDPEERIDGSARERDRDDCPELGASPMKENRRRADEKWGLD